MSLNCIYGFTIVVGVGRYASAAYCSLNAGKEVSRRFEPARCVAGRSAWARLGARLSALLASWRLAWLWLRVWRCQFRALPMAPLRVFEAGALGVVMGTEMGGEVPAEAGKDVWNRGREQR